MKKRLLACLLTLVMLLALLPATALAAEPVATGTCGATGNEDNVTWKVEQNNTDSENPTYTLTIFGTGAVKGNPATNNWANFAEQITNIVVGEGITKLGSNLTKNTCAVSISLPATLEEVTYSSDGSATFGNPKTEINSITVAVGNTHFKVIDRVLFTANGDTLIRYTAEADNSYDIPASVSTIASKAFAGSSLTAVTIPNSVTTIMTDAFSRSSLVEVTIPASVTTCGSSIFNGTNTLQKAVLNCTTLGTSMFTNCIALTDVTLSEGLSVLPQNAFRGCSALTSIRFPASVAKFESPKATTGALSGTALTRIVVLSDGDLEIQEGTFGGLQEVEARYVTIGSVNGTVTMNASFTNSKNNNIVYAKFVGNINFNCSLFTGKEYADNTRWNVLDLTEAKNITINVPDKFLYKLNSRGVVYVPNAEMWTTVLAKDTTESGHDYTRNYAITNGGTFPTATQFIAGQLAEPIMGGYKFEGWYESATFEGTALTGTPVAGTTYYAKWALRALDHITVESKQAEYVVGTTLTAADFTVTKVYDNGETETVDPSDYTVAPAALTAAGDVTVTITYNEQTYSCSITVVPAPVIPVTPSAPAQLPFNPDAGKTKFTDVSDNAWYASAVNYAVDRGLMNGTGDSKFSPEADTTRGMIVTILARLDGKNTSGTPWYQAGQRWAMEYEISDGTNMPGAITREQLVAMLFRYAVKNGLEAVTLSENLTQFTDASDISAWAVSAMQWAVGQGLIQGSNGQLRPQANASRAEVATILMRFCEVLCK